MHKSFVAAAAVVISALLIGCGNGDDNSAAPDAGGAGEASVEAGFAGTPPAQPDLEIVLMPTEPGPMMDQETCDALRALVDG